MEKCVHPLLESQKNLNIQNRKTNRNNYEIRAEATMINQEGVSQFSGEVEVIQGERAIAAELIKYDKKQKTFSAEGRAHVWDANVLWAGERATYDTRKEISTLENGNFWSVNDVGRGASSRIRNSRINQRTKLECILHHMSRVK